MYTAIEHLEAAIHTGYQELQALNADDTDKAATLVKKRTQLVEQAWSLRHTCDAAMYKEKLQTLQKIQQKLIQVSQKKQHEIRQGISRSRKETRRLAGYKQALSYG